MRKRYIKLICFISLVTSIVIGAFLPISASAAVIRPLADIIQNSNVDNLSYEQILNNSNRTGVLYDIQGQMEARRVNGSPELIREIPELINLQLAIIDKAIIKYPDHQTELERAKQVINKDRSTVHTDKKIGAAAAANSCNSIWDFSVEGCLKAGFSWVGAFLVFIFVKITVFANYLFNQAINISVRTFSDYANSNAVTTSWGVIRDLVNMGFIFVLLYIAIGTILGLSGLDWKKLVPKLIIVALLVNFSAFFTRVIIDVSNVTANQFYLASASPYPVPPGQTPDVTTALFKNIKVFSNNPSFGLGLTDDKGNKTVEQLQGAVGLDWKQIVIGTFGGVALALVASFVLLAGAVLFIIRTIRLLFLIILSPFAFFFFILPGTDKYTTQWWKALTNEALFAPAFLIMIYVVTQITKAINSKDDGSVIFFMLIIGLLLGALIVAKALGAVGASKVIGIGKKLGAVGAGALVGGGLGFAGRRTAGWAANRFAESKLGATIASKGGWMGRLGMRGGEKITKSSFDVRASKIAKGAGLGGILGGKAQKGGYAATIEAEKKQEKAVLKKIEGKLGEEKAKQYAETLLERPGGGQRAKTATGVGLGASIGGIAAGPVGAVVGGVVGGVAGGALRLYRNKQNRLIRKAKENERRAEEETRNGKTQKAEAYRAKAERQKKKAEKVWKMGQRKAPVQYQEVHEDYTNTKEKALTAEIAEIEKKTRDEFIAGQEGETIRTLNREVESIEKQIKATEKEVQQTGGGRSIKLETLNKELGNSNQQLKLVQEDFGKKLTEKIKGVTKDKELEREILRRAKSGRAKSDEESKRKKTLKDIIDDLNKDEGKGEGERKSEGNEEKEK